MTCSWATPWCRPLTGRRARIGRPRAFARGLPLSASLGSGTKHGSDRACSPVLPHPLVRSLPGWDKTGTHVWDFDASTGSFPDSVTPLEGWVPLRAWEPSSAGPAMGYTLDELTGFLNLETGERVGLEAIEEACRPATLDDSSREFYCRVTAKFKQQHLILRASDGWIVGDDVGYIATVAPRRLEPTGDAPGCPGLETPHVPEEIPRSGIRADPHDRRVYALRGHGRGVVGFLDHRVARRLRRPARHQRGDHHQHRTVVLRNWHRQPQRVAG